MEAGMIARDLMTRDPRVVTPGQPLQHAARIMRDLDTGLVPVVDHADEHHLRGVVTDRGIAALCVAAGHANACTVAQHMAAEGFPTVGPAAHAGEVAERMRASVLHRVLVVEEDRLVGIIAPADLARHGLSMERELAAF
jgi:CBS domain-containing protein